MHSARPLDNFPVIRTLDIEEMRDALARIYVKPTLALAQPTGGFRVAINECRLEHVRISYGAYGAPLRLEFPAADCFLHILPIRGVGEIVSKETRLPLAAGTGATISPDAGFRANFDADYECLYLTIEKNALTQKLVAMTGVTVIESLRMEPQIDTNRPAAKILYQYLPLLVDTLSTALPPFPPWWVSQTEQLLMVMFLCSHQHNYSHLLDQEASDAALWQVRRVEDYIEANWKQPIAVKDIAEVAGVSEFSLFRAFKKIRGYSPLDFVARVRASRRGDR